MDEIIMGRSMMLHFPEYRFMTSAIMGGMLPIACGLAAAGERVWCFVGDMAASCSGFADALLYTVGHKLPLTFVIEDNGLSTNTPTDEVWGIKRNYPDEKFVRRYQYKRTTQHCGTDTYVSF